MSAKAHVSNTKPDALDSDYGTTQLDLYDVLVPLSIHIDFISPASYACHNMTLYAPFILCLVSRVRAQPCFFPSGEQSLNYYPCDANAHVSMCCWGSAVCLTNGLCSNGAQLIFDNALNKTVNNSYFRGTCTDNQWGSAVCPQHCLSSKLLSCTGHFPAKG